MILERRSDGSYRWACDACRRESWAHPAPGPRRRLCVSCKNAIAYRKKHPVIRRSTATGRRAGLEPGVHHPPPPA